LSKANGSPAWNVKNTSFNATPAYDPSTGSLFAGGADSRVYKIDGKTGQVLQTYTANSAINKAVLLVGSYVYVVTDGGQLIKLSTSTLTPAWAYSAGVSGVTPPSYSTSRDAIVFATSDLHVRAVNNASGALKWNVKPSPNAAGFPNMFDDGWPVIAEKHGVVFVRMMLNQADTTAYPSTKNIFPTTNAATRSWLQSAPQHQNLFALNLDDGSLKFVPAVGYGSTEDYMNGSSYGVMGSQPVVKVWPNGDEVAYIHFRNGQSNPPDYRWDGNMGEMVLDNTTVPGLVAGDLRFVRMSSLNGQGNAYVYLIDEQDPLTIAGSTIFHAHWGASESDLITNRSTSLGLSYGSPISTTNHPTVIRRQTACGNFNPSTHWTTCGLSLFNDTRGWSGPGFWTYWNVMDPPGSPNPSGYSGGFLPRYTYVSSGLMIVEGNGGELMAFTHANGPAPTATAVGATSSPTTSATASAPTATATRTPTTVATSTPTTTPSGPPVTASPTTTASSGAPQILNLTSQTSSPSANTLIEWTFDLSKVYANPYFPYDPSDTASIYPTPSTGSNPAESWYGVNGVSVDMHLTSPSGKTIVQPAFWMAGYLRAQSGTTEVLGQIDNGRWHVRFTPTEVGSYSFYLTAQDASGTGTSSTGAFTVAGSSAKGFIHPSAADSRFLAYDNGQSFIPVGSGHEWWGDGKARSYDFDNTFATWRQNGINLTRIWTEADFSLGIEGAQPVWTCGGNPTNQVTLVAANVHSGLRAAALSGSSTCQNHALAAPSVPYRLSAWIASSGVTGASVKVTAGIGGTGSVLGSLPSINGTTGYTYYTTTFTPGASNAIVSLGLVNNGAGTLYVDDLQFGPDNGAGGVTYNVVSDPGFERHFCNGCTGNDPNANPSLPRPIGTYINQWAAAELDNIVSQAQANGVELQLCSCSGPWFTWSQNPSDSTIDYNQTWLLHAWERNFRYRVARWGYSPAVLAWELQNETGHVPPNSAEYSFFQKYGAYQQSVDPNRHLRTTSQNSQAYSPGMWSSSAMDAANYHDYMDNRGAYPVALNNDESQFIYLHAWCLQAHVTGYCQAMGLGDGSSWSGPAKPWVWGEIGVVTSGTPLQSGKAGVAFVHNILWAGLFSPAGTTPLDWYWNIEDGATTTARLAARKAASLFFTGVDYAGGKLVYLMTPTDAPTGYSGETVTASDPNARVYAMRRADQTEAYLWVQNRASTWYNGQQGSTPSPINPSITIGNLLARTYTVEIWNTSTGAIISSSQQTPSGGKLSIQISNLTGDVAVKIH
jgi:hypothetical protein